MQQAPAHLADELLEQDIEDATENVLISSDKMVLMQTARGNILNPNNEMEENACMLFDSGSQRTYITEALAKKLNLTLGEKSKNALVTFGSKKPQLVDTPSTVLNMKLRDGTILKLTANVIPTIIGEMQRRPLDKRFLQNWEYLWRDNVLADALPTKIENSTIDLLISNDYYLDLIPPQKVEISQDFICLGQS